MSSRAHSRLLAFINVFLLTVSLVLFVVSPDIYIFASGVSVVIIHIDLLLSSLHNSDRNSNFRFILMWLVVILFLSYSCQIMSFSVKNCHSNCSYFY